MIKHTRNTLATVAIAGVLAGCSSIPDESQQPNLTEISESQTSDWEATPAVTYRDHRQPMHILEPGQLPASIYNRDIDMELAGTIEVQDLARLLQSENIPVAIASEESASQQIRLPAYTGSLGTFLATVSAMTDLSFNWQGGVLLIDTSSQYMVRIPQSEEVSEQIADALESFGAESISTSNTAGSLAYRASSEEQVVIESYLDRIAVNTAVVNLQVAVINVSLDNERNSGLDWSSLSAQVGDIDLFEDATVAPIPLPPIEDGGESGGEGADGGGEAGGDELLMPEDPTGVAADITNSGIRIAGEGSEVSLDGVLNLLSTYGESRTTQNLTLKTLSGVPVELRSGESIPYVEEVEVSVNEGSDTSLGGTETSTVETGFNTTLKPFFDAEEELITVDLEMDLKSLIGFRDLFAGDSVGTITQPETQDQNLNSIVRLKAGETALLGGLVYESISDNRSTLTGLEDYNAGSKSVTTSNNALFILMRPTVTVYGPADRSAGRE
jgi:type II secretory pathway component GspD/PulD (secretin)